MYLLRFGDIGALRGGRINVDYENAAIISLRQIFPEVTIQGCLFHYAQCINRAVQRCGLQVAYNNNEVVKRWVRKIVSLALLPPYLVVPTWQRLMNPPNHGKSKSLINKIVTYVYR